MSLPQDLVDKFQKIIPVPSLIKPGEFVPSNISAKPKVIGSLLPSRPSTYIVDAILPDATAEPSSSINISIGGLNKNLASSVQKASSDTVTMRMIKNTLVSKGDGFAKMYMEKAARERKNLSNVACQIIIDPLDDLTSPFKSLTFRFNIDEDPRLKAISVYTCFSPKLVSFIKHGPEIIYCTYLPVRNLYVGSSNDVPDITNRSEDEHVIEVVANSKTKVGMVRGGPEGGRFGSYYSEEHYFTEIAMFDRNEVFTSDPTRSKSFALDSNNPLCDREFEIFDTHPIPSDIYSVWGYYSDITLVETHEKETILSTREDRPENYAVLLAYKEYAKSGFKSGTIVRLDLDLEDQAAIRNRYLVRTPNGDETWAQGQLSSYSTGTFVLISKASNGNWYIIPSSFHYYANAVEAGEGLG